MKVIEVISELTGVIKTKVSYTDISKALGVSRQRVAQLKDKHLSNEQIESIENYFKVNLTNVKYKDEIKLIEIPVFEDIPENSKQLVYFNGHKYVYPFSNKFLESLNVNFDSLQITFARGNAMKPVIENGDCLLLDTSQKEIFDGRIYCIKIENEICIRRLQKIPPGKIKITA